MAERRDKPPLATSGSARLPSAMGVDADVIAAGGVVLRRRGGKTEVALIHRPDYEDWTLPKGKLDADEGWEDAALREVREETGLECKLGDEVQSARYLDGKGRRKLVRYWRMRPVRGRFAANDEVDQLEWLEPKQALKRISYARDREVLKSALD